MKHFLQKCKHLAISLSIIAWIIPLSAHALIPLSVNQGGTGRNALTNTDILFGTGTTPVGLSSDLTWNDSTKAFTAQSAADGTYLKFLPLSFACLSSGNFGLSFSGVSGGGKLLDLNPCTRFYEFGDINITGNGTRFILDDNNQEAYIYAGLANLSLFGGETVIGTSAGGLGSSQFLVNGNNQSVLGNFDGNTYFKLDKTNSLYQMGDLGAVNNGTTLSLDDTTNRTLTSTAKATVLSPYSTSSGNTQDLRFLELAANGTNYVSFKSPDSLAGNLSYTLWGADSAGCLKSNGSLVLSISSCGGGSAALTATQVGFGDGSNLMTGSSNLTYDSTNQVLNIGGVTALSNTRLQTGGTVAGFLQNNIQNLSSSPSASSDWVATANNGSDTTHYINMGINSSGGGGSPFTSTNAGYLYTIDDELDLGALGSKPIIFFTSGGTSPVERGRISATASTLTMGVSGATLGTLQVSGNTSGVVSIVPQAAAGTWTLTLPTSGGSNGNFLQTNGSGVTSWAESGNGGGTSGWSGQPLTFATTTTQYAPYVGGGLPNATETNVSTKASGAATISQLHVTLDAAIGASATLAITFEDGTGAASALTCTTSSGGTSCDDTTHSVNIADGDLLSWKLVSSGVVTAGLPQIKISYAVGTSLIGVTSASFTGGLISVATATTTPAFTVAGTSGGIPYFSSASTWASSGVLVANALVIGGGAGATPATTTTGTGVLTFLGTPSSANLISAVTDETGSGKLAFATTPALLLPTISDSSDATKTLAFVLSGMTTAKTLTLSSSQSTNQTLTIPNITQAETIAVQPQVSQSSPSDPTGTTNTTGLMMGMAGAITPRMTGRILITISGDISNDTADDGAKVQARYGTGTAPTNAAALTGTTCGGLVVANSTVPGAGTLAMRDPFSVQCIATGLTVGTAYWIDAGLAAITGGTATIKNVSITAFEL